MIISLLKKAVEQGLLRPLDLQLARHFHQPDKPLLALAIAWLSSEVGSGHVCLPIHYLTKTNLFSERAAELVDEIWLAVGEPQESDWQRMLIAANCVSNGSYPTPFVYDNDGFYLQRMWRDEGRVAEFFNQSHANTVTNPESVKQILAQLFPAERLDANETDWQKIAAAVAVSQNVAVISGGPGTGKTTTVAKLLASLILLGEKTRPRIVLAAPTGKAAARLTESLGYALANLPLTAEQKAFIPDQAVTIHRLLGVKSGSNQVHYHQENPFHLDILVVDEASMIDLPMMARLINALPKQARLILLGDREQLASVEAGAVLGDICRFIEKGYSQPKCELLMELTGCALADLAQQDGPVVRDSLALLRKSYRFSSESGIGQLAGAINQGHTQRVLTILQSEKVDLVWHELQAQHDYQTLIETCVEGYRPYLELRHHNDTKAILAQFNQFQLLCALRHGPFGVDGLNQQIELALIRHKLINKTLTKTQVWYAGRPVMVTRNDSSLGLYNGDIGITLYDEERQLRVYFQLPDGTIRSVQTNRLPTCETAFAMTVHKSQGSEFDHTMLVLPDSYSPLLTRELLYTAVTRAKQKLTLFANKNSITLAVRQPTERRSGLAERLV